LAKEWILNSATNRFQLNFSRNGGKVFYVISIKKGDKKEIYNKEVINEIKDEIIKLKK
jgi:hypothetical protein